MTNGMHDHTDECLNGCTHLALQNQFLAGLIDYKEKQDKERKVKDD